MNKSRLSYQFDLVMHLVRRNFILHYKGSVLGILWSLLLPLSQLLVLVFLFRRVIRLDIVDYPAFVFTALLPWNWFSTSVNSAADLFIGNRDLVRRPNFVAAILAVVNTLSHLLTYIVSLPILLCVLALYGRGLTSALVVLPLLILIQGALIVGLTFIVGILNVFYRDVQHVTSVATMLLFYLTPVFYNPSQVGGSYRVLYTLNPMAVLIQSYRAVLYEGKLPEWSSLLFAAMLSAVFVGFGYFVYHRKIHDVIDTL